MSKLKTYAVIFLVIYLVATAPTVAASLAEKAGGGLGQLADGAIAFLEALAN